ncbi:MAG: hypothetical protein HKP37_09540, partial [Boseongicola sp.]|nr:hypothetical protein [Boseongicola sp.]
MSVSIEDVSAQSVEIGAPVFGVETIASLEGAFRLEDGEGSARLGVKRLNGDGQLALDTSYSNATEVLALDLSLAEAADGIVANLIGLPGQPPLAFSIQGEAPLSDYSADIQLATDGQDRLTGRISTTTPEDDANATRTIEADVSGDIAPLFDAAYQPFFGPNTSLIANITTFKDGSTDISDLSISADSLSLEGRVSLAPGGFPREIAVEGEIISASGTSVLLPLSGPETRVDRVDLDVTFDASEDDLWTGAFEIVGLSRPGFSAQSIILEGDGRINAVAPQAVGANLQFAAITLDLGNPDAEQALGEEVTGQLKIDWTSGEPLQLTDLTIEGESYGLTGSANVEFSSNGPKVAGQAAVQATRLSAFSGIANRTLGGAAELATKFQIEPLAGFFDVSAEGLTRDLIVSQPQADGILDGEVDLAINARRNTNGTFLTIKRLTSPNAEITGRAALRTGASEIELDASLADAALILQEVTGPLRVTASANETLGRWMWSLDSSFERTILTATGTAVDIFGTPVVAANGRLVVDNLAYFTDLAGRPLSGSVDTVFTTEVVSDLSRATLNLDGSATDLAIGQPQADAILTGELALLVDVALADQVITFRQSSINGPAATLLADGTISSTTGSMDISGRITDLASVLDGAPNGPLSFETTIGRDADTWEFDLKSNGPAAALTAKGSVNDPTGPTPQISGKVSATLVDLSIFSELAARDLSGSLELDASGVLIADLSTFEIDATASGTNVRTGVGEIDTALAGALTADVKA